MTDGYENGKMFIKNTYIDECKYVERYSTGINRFWKEKCLDN